ncbi:DUF4760 domain-containing protein [Kovacikia minuta CCNUW1]|uniref:DUF4760 domain-containing protein n=1 Tax=Kovacikia minuta TaxID=2931930 RepID=UPI001CCE0EFC|nr:DUF4760 domain-containing protein [Kovacikia minuta]UBF26423.1 DUF4760 domain-containing protein [Kovacikia minuta CCNUW1]
MSIKKRKQLGEYSFTIKFSIRVGAISFAIALISVSLFYWVTQKFDKEFLQFTVAVVGVAAAVTSAFYVGSAIQENSKARKEDRAISLISTWNDSYYSGLRRTALRKIRDLIKTLPLDEQPHAVHEVLKTDNSLEEDIVTILNFLEEVAACVNNDLVDIGLIDDYFGYIIPRVAFVFKSWITGRQDGRNNSLYSALETLGKEWKDNLK